MQQPQKFLFTHLEVSGSSGFLCGQAGSEVVLHAAGGHAHGRFSGTEE